MIVAQLRGAEFVQSSGNIWVPKGSRSNQITADALTDVALALGFPTSNTYNAVCYNHPENVKRKLEAL